MINDKEIDIAARAQALSKHINETAYFHLRSIEDFKDGAHWAINEFLKDLWHPASEEPDVRNKTIICLYDDGSICQDYEVYDIATDHDTHSLQIGEFNWNCYAEDEEIKKWCYKDDLLPKKGGKQ
mgnify:CR=1 FL=1